jgi:hypothetical protein
MKKILVCLILIWTFLLSACPKDSAVRKAARTSYELSGLTLDAVNATGKAYAQHVIDLPTKNKIANSLKSIAIGGQRFNQVVTALNAANANSVSTDRLALLNQILSEEIVAPFLDILQTLKAISTAQANYLHVAIAALRTAILTISAAISDNRSIQKLQEVNAYA